MSKPVIGGIEGIPQEQFSTLVKRVLQAINVADSPLTEGELLGRVSGKKQYKVKIVRYCNDQGLISRTGTGKKGDPYLYFLSHAQSEQNVVEEKPVTDSVDECARSSFTSPQNDAIAVEGSYRSYKLPTGESLKFNKQEFDDVVEIFKLLNEQHQKLESSGLLESAGYREVVLRTDRERDSSNPE